MQRSWGLGLTGATDSRVFPHNGVRGRGVRSPLEPLAIAGPHLQSVSFQLELSQQLLALLALGHSRRCDAWKLWPRLLFSPLGRLQVSEVWRVQWASQLLGVPEGDSYPGSIPWKNLKIMFHCHYFIFKIMIFKKQNKRGNDREEETENKVF